jgi:hypothetical protein
MRLQKLDELSRCEGILRKRLLALSAVYPSHGEFLEKLGRLDDEGLAVVLRRLGFWFRVRCIFFGIRSGVERKVVFCFIEAVLLFWVVVFVVVVWFFFCV